MTPTPDDLHASLLGDKSVSATHARTHTHTHDCMCTCSARRNCKNSQALRQHANNNLFRARKSLFSDWIRGKNNNNNNNADTPRRQIRKKRRKKETSGARPRQRERERLPRDKLEKREVYKYAFQRFAASSCLSCDHWVSLERKLMPLASFESAVFVQKIQEKTQASRKLALFIEKKNIVWDWF